MKKKIMFTIIILFLCLFVNSFYYKVASPSISDDIALSTVNEKDSTNRMVLRQSQDINNNFEIVLFLSFFVLVFYIWRSDIKKIGNVTVLRFNKK